MCGMAKRWLLQGWKGRLSGAARDDNNIGTRATIKFFFLQGKASKEIHAVLTETLGEQSASYSTVKKTGWPSLNVVIFPPVMRLVLDVI
jgi:hypothetical protein